jgi:anti-sigma B factor antagonist
MNTRPVGDVIVVRCNGRLVAGPEVQSLQSHVRSLLPEVRTVILQLEQVSFVDSSGLGSMVRLASSARVSGAEVKLCAIPSMLRKTLEMTNLLSLFDIHDSEADAITAAYLGSRYAHDRSAQAQPRILCVHDSPDVLAYVSELLCRSGYRALSCSNVHDARILLKAAGAKLIILSPNLQIVHGRPAEQAFREIDPHVPILVLQPNFAELDAGAAAEELLGMVRTSLAQG